MKNKKTKIKKQLRNIRTFLHWLTSPRITASMIVNDLRGVGITEGQTLMVHSSLSAIGYVPNGAEDVLNALIEVLGPKGTLILPAHSWREMEAGCRHFDVRKTPCTVGKIPERFRRWPGVVRSLHPTHSVAVLGPRADELVRGHLDAANPCGAGTPYWKFLETGGQILLLGTDLRSLTVFHTIEALANVSYLMKPAPDLFEIVDQDGVTQQRFVHRHAAGIPAAYQKQEQLLVNRGLLKRHQVGCSRSYLLDGRGFLQAMNERIRENPDCLLRK